MLKQLYEFGLWCYCFWFTARLLQEFKKFQTEAEGREEELHKEIELSQERLIDAEVKKNIVTFNFICTKFNLRLKIKSWLEQCLNCYLRINLLVLHQLSFLALQLVVSLFCRSLFRSACVFWEKSQVYYSGGIQTNDFWNWAVPNQLDHRDSPIARGSSNPCYPVKYTWRKQKIPCFRKPNFVALSKEFR